MRTKKLMVAALLAIALFGVPPFAQAQSKELTIYAFKGGYGEDYWNAIVPIFEKAYGCKVNLTVNPQIGQMLRPKIISGDAPDLMYVDWGDRSSIMESLNQENGLMDLTGLFDQKAYDKNAKLKETILPGFLESSFCTPKKDGKIYAAPFYYSSMGLVYNKDYFDKKGLKPPKTWDDFFALGEAAKKDGRALFTYQGIYPGYLESFVWPSVADAVGSEGIRKVFDYTPGSLKGEDAKKVFQNIAEVAKRGYLMKGTTALNHTQSQAAMMLGKALFIPNGTWMEGEMKDAPREEGFEFAVAAPPSLKAGSKQYALVGLEVLSIPVGAKNPDLAKEFIKFTYSDQALKLNAEKAKGILPVKGALELVKPLISASTYNFFTMFDQGALPLLGDYKPLPKGTKINRDDTWWNNHVTKVMNGQETVDAWLADIEAAYVQVQADYSKEPK